MKKTVYPGGSVTEDRNEWLEELHRRCTEIYVDPGETDEGSGGEGVRATRETVQRPRGAATLDDASSQRSVERYSEWT